jgi:hypothetical protein
MKIFTSNIPPLIFGTWILRITNDINIESGLNFVQINEEPIIKLKTVKQEGFFGIKKSRTAVIENIKNTHKNSYNFTLNYSTKNTYSYSFLGIEIPEFKSKSVTYDKINDLTLNIFDKTLLVTDNELSLYYIFDLNVGKIKYPNVETSLNTFLFTQLIGILLSIIIAKIL